MRHFYLSFYLLLISTCISVNWARADTEYETALILENGMIATEALVYDIPPSELNAVVLLIHGWAGQMDEVGDIYKRLAMQLREQDIASLRINIRGESERERTNFHLTSTFETRIADAQTGLDYLLKRYPNAKIGVLGFSLGGSTAMALTGANASAIKSLVLWSSAGDPSMLFDSLTPAQHEQVMRSGETIISRWVELRVSKKHYQGFKGYDIFTPLKAYTGALLSIRGTEDYIPPQEQAILDAASAYREEYWMLGGADHIFQAFDPSSQYDERVIDRTTHWFVETLPQ